MGLFKDVKKPVIRQAPRGADISPLRPSYAVKQPPCSAHCGAGADVRAWLTVLARAEAGGRPPEEAYEAAWRILTDAHPFPATLGRICPASCEQSCHRRAKEGAVAVNALERWLGDVALARGFPLPAAARSVRAGRVGIVGAGPAGLSCAYHLARRGHEVTIVEASPLPGGRLRDATRTGRLAAGILDAEIARVLAIGIGLRCGVRVDDLDAFAAGYDFVFVATGRKSAIGRSEMEGGQAGRGSLGPRMRIGGDALHPGLVSAALANGRHAAEAIDAALNERIVAPVAPAAPVAVERVTLAWYPDAPRHDWPLANAESHAERVSAPFDCAQGALSEVEWPAACADIVAEAKRCMSCGLCMDCERCWMYCTNNCFEKLPAGPERQRGAYVPYSISTEKCNGCRKCADECPCGYIDMI